MARRRLDAELVRRGLAADRAEARAAVAAGLVTIGGSPATKSTTMVAAEAALQVSASAERYVSRGGEKLRAALDGFDVLPAGRDCLDAGASSGGFTDCLLQAGAARVAAVDVGYGQLAWELRNDPRVTVLDRTNVRALLPRDLPFVPELIVADLSFISLCAALPALARVSGDDAELVLLVKPQFEAGRAEVARGGVVRDPAVWRRVLEAVAACGAREGIGVLGVIASPLLGPSGNVEFLMHAAKGREDVSLELDAAVTEGEALRR